MPIEDKFAFSGADLALYKAEEEEAEPAEYTVYILQRVPPAKGYIVGQRTISSQCSGWQVFHLRDFLVGSLEPGINPLPIRLIVFKQNQLLSCSEIASLFVLNATLYHPPPLGSGDGELEGGEELAGLDAITPFHIPSKLLINYIPVLNFFNTNISRVPRDAPNSIARMERGADIRRCRRSDKMAVLQDHVNSRGDNYTILHPVEHNIGECTWEDASREEEVWLYSKQVCAPIKYRVLELLVKTEAGHISVYSNADLAIEECSWMEDPQDTI